MDQITKDDLVGLIDHLAEKMIAAKDLLNTLDGAIGDGDLGITMTLGFQAIKKQLLACQTEDMQAILTDCGMAFADNAASTFGALMATMFTRAGRVVKGKDAIGRSEEVAILNAAAEGVQKRGGASLGDKTLLDALIPAAEAMEAACSSGQSLLACTEAGLQAARLGAEKTIQMRSKAGRSGWLGDRTVGQKDPGAAALVLMLEAVVDYLSLRCE